MEVIVGAIKLVRAVVKYNYYIGNIVKLVLVDIRLYWLTNFMHIITITFTTCTFLKMGSYSSTTMC